MPSTKPARIRFRSVRDRTFEDQAAAMGAGYNSVLELAFDEMLQALVELQTRVDRLEGADTSHTLHLQGADPED